MKDAVSKLQRWEQSNFCKAPTHVTQFCLQTLLQLWHNIFQKKKNLKIICLKVDESFNYISHLTMTKTFEVNKYLKQKRQNPPTFNTLNLWSHWLINVRCKLTFPQILCLIQHGRGINRGRYAIHCRLHRTFQKYTEHLSWQDLKQNILC